MKRATAFYLIERRRRIRKFLYTIIAIWSACIAVAVALEVTLE
jgi:hypothetical protein